MIYEYTMLSNDIQSPNPGDAAKSQLGFWNWWEDNQEANFLLIPNQLLENSFEKNLLHNLLCYFLGS